MPPTTQDASWGWYAWTGDGARYAPTALADPAETLAPGARGTVRGYSLDPEAMPLGEAVAQLAADDTHRERVEALFVGDHPETDGDAIARELGAFPNLQALAFHTPMSRVGFEALRDLPLLSGLDVTGFDVDDEAWSGLLGLESLRSLVVSGGTTRALFDVVASHPALVAFRTWYEPVSRPVLLQVLGSRSLRRVAAHLAEDAGTSIAQELVTGGCLRSLSLDDVFAEDVRRACVSRPHGGYEFQAGGSQGRGLGYLSFNPSPPLLFQRPLACVFEDGPTMNWESLIQVSEAAEVDGRWAAVGRMGAERWEVRASTAEAAIADAVRRLCKAVKEANEATRARPVWVDTDVFPERIGGGSSLRAAGAEEGDVDWLESVAGGATTPR